MRILVTGGMGYIGSHTVVELLTQGHQIIILDNLSNSSVKVLDRIKTITGKTADFVLADIRNQEKLNQVFAEHSIDAVIHFAGLKAVGESVQQPLNYYENNVAGTICLLQAMQQAQVCKLIFSSSATVYGANAQVPYTEETPIGQGTNPYGSSKIMIEQMLVDLCYANPNWSVQALRYFNPIGAHESGLIGEKPSGIPNNLLPYLTQVAVGKLEQLSVYGDDYPTPDGSCLRDYIHVVDLAHGHLAALAKLNQPGFDAYNLGTGNGFSVLEVIREFEAVNAVKVPYKIAPRRAGDLAEVWANTDKSSSKLNWTAKHSLPDMLRSAWVWEQNQAKQDD